MINDEEKRVLAQYRLEKSDQAMADVKLLVDNQRWIGTANRLYYAAFNAVSALLLMDGINAKTHNGVVGMFGQHYVKTGKVSAELGSVYSRLFTLRTNGDYGDFFDVQEGDILPLLKPAEKLIDTIKTLINNK